MSYAWVYLYRSYIVIDPPTCGACCLESFASQISIVSGNTACASTSLNPKVIPYESTIPSYMRYLPAIPSKFVCAKL